MIVETPDPLNFAAVALAGITQAGVTEAQEIGVVLKASYDLVEDSAGIHDFVPSGRPERAAIVFEDEGQHRYTDGDGITHIIPANAFSTVPEGEPRAGDRFFTHDGAEVFLDDFAGSQALSFDLTYEADIALDKARSDIVVEGFRAGTTDGAVVVNGQVWMERASAVPLSLDTSRNLFGWHGKGETPRRGTLSESYDPATDGALPNGPTAAFNNVYRRSTGFSTPGNRNMAALPSGALVQIYHDTDTSGDPDFAARLPDLTIGIRLRVYCGHGPDEAPRWRKLGLGTLRPDTLILRPGGGTADILWRARWAADLEAQENYRSVQLRRGGF